MLFRSEIARQSESLLAALNSMRPQAGAVEPITRDPLDAALDDFVRLFDRDLGGIGHAPKFPHPYELAFCLRRHVMDDHADALAIVRTTLTQMAEGGIYDHLGGGFARYSVDDSWTIPHFEKMLYDNGPLLALYSDAWRVTHDPRYRAVCEETAEWVMRVLPAVNFHRNLAARNGGANWRRDNAAHRTPQGAARPPEILRFLTGQNGGSEMSRL